MSICILGFVRMTLSFVCMTLNFSLVLLFSPFPFSLLCAKGGDAARRDEGIVIYNVAVLIRLPLGGGRCRVATDEVFYIIPSSLFAFTW